ncbi:metal ABC transporter ATP-binding protein [Liquorilactobacillus vini]|uniref:Zinc abc transporteratp-binding protein n=1 Tax=Liquorilactobacillus vini DSM 20605 TaxID=1133569 RepID=A0A0R2CA20_9LACO|nr:ATP-binding cassette domain-containing protein [Liquorilactobacillus vini]KRM88670.1 zinc abc transporteratp-binding protein [Liquorilactobacillus vini DSM 20605]
MSDQPLIQVEHLAMAFGTRKLFTDLSFTLKQGDFFCLLGANGTGKTTIIKLLLQQLHPTAGTISFNERLKSAADIGYVPQFRNLSGDYPLSIKNFISLKLCNSFTPWLSQREKQAVTKALQQTGLTAKQNQRLGTSSGGEKQRAYLAQAILNQPQLLILDEPTASLDQDAKYEVLETVQHLNQVSGMTIIFISHDWPLVKKFGQHFLELRAGSYISGSTTELQLKKEDENV